MVKKEQPLEDPVRTAFSVTEISYAGFNEIDVVL